MQNIQPKNYNYQLRPDLFDADFRTDDDISLTEVEHGKYYCVIFEAEDENAIQNTKARQNDILRSDYPKLLTFRERR